MSQEEHEEVWRSISGSDRLYDIYGYFPTFHDAKIRKINVSFDRKKIALVLLYSDLRGDSISRESIKVQTEIGWIGVREADLKWYSEYLYGVKFARHGSEIRTSLTPYSFGCDGDITSTTVEIRSVEIIPKDVKETSAEKISIFIK